MALISSAITARLAAIGATITAANGYTSNLGTNVRIAQERGQGRDAPALYIVPGRQRETHRYARSEMSRDYTIKGFVDLRAHSPLDDYEIVDKVIWDLRQAYGARDTTLAALVDRIQLTDDQPGYSEEGGSLCGAALTLTVVYTVDPTDPTTD